VPNSLSIGSFVSLVLLPAAVAAASPLPVLQVRNVQETFFGTAVDDPYRHFEDTKATEVAAWMKAHSDHARATRRAIPGRDALRKRVEQLDAGAPARVRDVTRSAGGASFGTRGRFTTQDARASLAQRRYSRVWCSPCSFMIVAAISSIDLVVDESQRMPSRRIMRSAAATSWRQFSSDA